MGGGGAALPSGAHRVGSGDRRLDGIDLAGADRPAPLVLVEAENAGRAFGGGHNDGVDAALRESEQEAANDAAADVRRDHVDARVPGLEGFAVVADQRKLVGLALDLGATIADGKITYYGFPRRIF